MDDCGWQPNGSDPETLSDDELSSLALAADPDAPLDADAVPWNFGFSPTVLPDWYMPRATARASGRVTRIVAVSMVVGLVVICAFGLCVTSGFIQIA
jgi:hypothetical protein